jgi:hypothetical protein
MATTNGTLIGTEQQLGGTGVNIPTRAGVVEHTLPFTTVLPTYAQLTSGNFNYRLRVAAHVGPTTMTDALNKGWCRRRGHRASQLLHSK